MDESRECASSTVKDAEQISEMLLRIQDVISDINARNSEIAGAVGRQSQMTQEINDSAGNIQHIGQRVSDAAQVQLRHCNDTVSDVAEQDKMIARFRLE